MKQNQVRTTEYSSKEYLRLLELADQATNRKQAIHLIHAADRIRQQMCQELSHPHCLG